MRFHVVSLPHTNTTDGFSSCAYTTKVRNFCKMMMDRGHEVFLYSGEHNDTPCTAHFKCVSEEERLNTVGGGHYVSASFDYTLPHWVNFNNRVIENLKVYIAPKDFICLIAGYAQKQIADAFPGHMSVEYGIGYGGSFSAYRVFESYAWMHMNYGKENSNQLHHAIGNNFHAVIPNYIDIKDFPYQHHKANYFAYLGRLVDLKGFDIAMTVCHAVSKQLILAGPKMDNTPIWYGQHIGELDPKRRGAFLSQAQALFVPTKYIEPFGTVAIEAMMCGTPVITSDWGAFTETVQNGFNGYRCRTLQQYIDATKSVSLLDPYKIRKKAVERYGLKVIGARYERYFEQLLTLWDKGWYKLKEAA